MAATRAIGATVPTTASTTSTTAEPAPLPAGSHREGSVEVDAEVADPDRGRSDHVVHRGHQRLGRRRSTLTFPTAQLGDASLRDGRHHRAPVERWPLLRPGDPVARPRPRREPDVRPGRRPVRDRAGLLPTACCNSPSSAPPDPYEQNVRVVAPGLTASVPAALTNADHGLGDLVDGRPGSGRRRRSDGGSVSGQAATIGSRRRTTRNWSCSADSTSVGPRRGSGPGGRRGSTASGGATATAPAMPWSSSARSTSAPNE